MKGKTKTGWWQVALVAAGFVGLAVAGFNCIEAVSLEPPLDLPPLGQGGEHVGGSTVVGGAGGSGGSSAGGTGGVDQPAGSPALETVNAGTVGASANYEMVFTFGQPSLHQHTSHSASFRLQGGFVGASGSL